MKKCVYTTIEYFPKSFSNESINVGFVFHNVTDGKIKFLKAKNKKRILAFDDELDADDYNMLMNSYEKFICGPFDKNLFSLGENKICYNENYLDSIKNNFLNEFRFSKIMRILSDDPERDYEEYSKINLYFDFDKKDRLKNEDITRALKRQLKQEFKTNNIEYEVKFDSSEISKFGEPLSLDFKVGSSTFIKILDIRSESFSKINTAKVWVFNKQYFDRNDLKLVFAITGKPETKEEMAYLDILKMADAPIYEMNNLSDMLMSLR